MVGRRELMPAYHQMGHDSQNLLGAVSGFAGAIVSPVNDVEPDVATMVTAHSSATFEFIFDPQLYFPRRGDRGQLSAWSYFPRDFETADISSDAWWNVILDELAATAARVGARAVCSPAIIAGRMFSNEYYDAMRTYADRLVGACAGSKLRVLQTVLVKLDDMADPTRALEIASVVSNTKAAGIYLVFLSDVKPRDELRDVEQLKGGMKLVSVLEEAGMPVLVGCSSSDILLWKTAGATSCATGKFANLRRFTPGRFNEPDEGGRLVAYWFEEALLAFIRGSDLTRVQPHGMAVATTTNPFGLQILAQFAADPSKPWVGLGWRQYMHWFADIEQRIASGAVTARTLIRAAEKNWQTLEDNDVFMEEKTNDGVWLRPWLRAVVEFNK
jgi:hypothetical protein